MIFKEDIKYALFTILLGALLCYIFSINYFIMLAVQIISIATVFIWQNDEMEITLEHDDETKAALIAALEETLKGLKEDKNNESK